jgi:hypothetical protein
VVPGLVDLALLTIELAQVEQCDALAPPIAHLAANGQRMLVIGMGLLHPTHSRM